MKSFFVIDVESVGLHGEGFSVAGGVYLENGAAQYEFYWGCPEEKAKGSDEDRKWVSENVPLTECTHRNPELVRQAFWETWLDAKAKFPEIVMAAECLWPVEARFVRDCVADAPTERNWDGPYPFLEISSVMLAAGMDPMANYERKPSEMPKHNPLSDARQSARLLAEALDKLKK